MAETVQEIVRRGSISIPPNNMRMYFKRITLDNEYESTWVEISQYVINFGTIKVGFPDGVFIGEYQEDDIKIVLDNNLRRFNSETDPDSLFFGYRTRHRTKFKIEIYAQDSNDNDVLLRAWYGLLTGLPVVTEDGLISITLCSPIKILQNYAASGIDLTAGTTEDLINRLVYKTQNGTSIFGRFFEGFSINPGSDTCMTITHPYVTDNDTVLDKIRDYSFYQDFFYYVDNNGYFVWDNKEPTSSTIWELNGAGSTDSAYGTNINQILSEVQDIDNTYTRVVLNYKENGIVDEKFFSGIRDTGDTATLSDANSATIFNWLKSNNYLDSTTYKLAHLYVTSVTALDAYLSATWGSYKDAIKERLNGLIKSEEMSVSQSTTWNVGDGSITDIYGEKTLEIDKPELITTEAEAVALRLYNAYKNQKLKWQIQVFGLFQLFPKDKLEINYIGEINTTNPFILGVSKLGGTDVLATRSGSILINGELVKLESISINLDNFDIIVNVRQI